MKLPIAFLGIATVLACASTSAQNSASQFSDNTLAQEQGLTQVSNGLYARTSPTSVHYIAVNPAGMSTLLQKLLELKASQAKATAGKSNVTTPSVLDQLIDQLSRPQPQIQVGQTGDCTGAGGTGEPQLSALATSGGGTIANANAVLTSDTSNPVTATTNVASAEIDNSLGNTVATQTITTAAATPANVSLNTANGCTAVASATVTCPGHTSPSIAAFANSVKKLAHGATCIL